MKPKVVAFLSGKGGSGKTTVAVSVAKLLAEMGHPCLLVDFDLATNGATYFFRDKCLPESQGLWEFLVSPRAESECLPVEKTLCKVASNFFFIPSRKHLKKKTGSYDSIPYQQELLTRNILQPILEWAESTGIHYVLLDCQAGYATTSAAAAEMSDSAVIVAEADSISSDAIDNLLIQLGNNLPDERRYLINKVDVRDVETYRNMRDVFQQINRLPPLPFDFTVRSAFGARQIPLDVNTPSSLLFALCETLKYVFTELHDEIKKFKTEHVDLLLEKYNKNLETLEKEKIRLQKEITSIIKSRFKYQDYITRTIIFITGFVVSAYSLINIAWITGVIDSSTVFKVAYPMLVTIFITFLYLLARNISKYKEAKSTEEFHKLDISRRIENINRELDYFRSSFLAESKEFLADAMITKRFDHPRPETFGKDVRERFDPSETDVLHPTR